MREHVNLEVAPVLEQFLTPGTADHSGVATVHLLRVSLEGSPGSQELGTQLALKVPQHVRHVHWKESNVHILRALHISSLVPLTLTTVHPLDVDL